MKSFSCLQPHFGELCLGRGPELLQYAGEWFCCRGFRQIVAGTLCGGLKALCQMEDEYIGNILYKFRDRWPREPQFRPEMSEKFVTESRKHVHAARRATNYRRAMGLQISEIENCVA